jgi:hypothetical protein
LLKPEWGFSGQSYSLTNGMLMLSDGSVESKIIGSKDWIDYRIILREIKPEFRVQMHAQDRDNYLEFRCGCSHSAAWGGEIQCRWLKVIDARSAEVPGATYNSGRKRHDACAPIGLLVLEHQEGVYRTFINGEQQIRFVDETFENGGFRLQGFGNMQLGSIEAHAMGATYGD